ncbi:hypothetical protein TIFTF001_030494 [Ficus carica]|uniref:Uncharacterized protein n=1 Tax=Ficus carica TaxID=3494 RepID=A0AA88DUC0_FICCA|nr:hypothetical protein TIFTF001_030494 [Ficus carica]
MFMNYELYGFKINEIIEHRCRLARTPRAIPPVVDIDEEWIILVIARAAGDDDDVADLRDDRSVSQMSNASVTCQVRWNGSQKANLDGDIM